MRDLDVGARVVGSELGRADGRVVGPDLVAGAAQGHRQHLLDDGGVRVGRRRGEAVAHRLVVAVELDEGHRALHEEVDVTRVLGQAGGDHGQRLGRPTEVVQCLGAAGRAPLPHAGHGRSTVPLCRQEGLDRVGE